MTKSKLKIETPNMILAFIFGLVFLLGNVLPLALFLLNLDTSLNQLDADRHYTLYFLWNLVFIAVYYIVLLTINAFFLKKTKYFTNSGSRLMGAIISILIFNISQSIIVLAFFNSSIYSDSIIIGSLINPLIIVFFILLLEGKISFSDLITEIIRKA